MTNLNAAIGLAQLEGVEDKLSRKRQIADLYEACFRNSPYEFHRSTGDVIHSYWMCSVLVPKNVIRDVARDFLTAEGIETRPFFYPAHTMPVYRHLNAGPFPIAEDLGARGINLPSYPGLSDEDVRFIASKVLTFTGH